MPFACWAEVLGGCGGGPSREHMISRSQFDGEMITVQGLPWCKEPKQVGIGSLVAKNLCRDHNTLLSPADAEAHRFKDALGELMSKPVLPVRRWFDARRIEQWLLKTTINLALQEAGSGIDVSEEIVRRAFALSPTPRSQGFFAVAELRETIGYNTAVRFESMTRKADGKLVIGAFVLHGWRALYAFEGAPPVNGAIRIREWNANPHWLRFRWRPSLELGDGIMPSLPHAAGSTSDAS